MSANETISLPFVIPCGYVYNLTVTNLTAPIDGWLCGFAAREGMRDTLSSYDGQNLTFSSISCGDGSMLYFNGTTSVLDGYVCGMSVDRSVRNAGFVYHGNWKLLFGLLLCAILATL